MSEEKVYPYMAGSVEVITGTPVYVDIEKAIGSVANIGYITSDDGQILVQINDRGGLTMTLETDNTYNFRKDEDWELRRIYISTTSGVSLTVRYMFKKVKKITVLN